MELLHEQLAIFGEDPLVLWILNHVDEDLGEPPSISPARRVHTAGALYEAKSKDLK